MSSHTPLLSPQQQATRARLLTQNRVCTKFGALQVAFEAAFGWGWLVELLEDYGFEPHLVHPLQCKAIASARLKKTSGTRCGWRG